MLARICRKAATTIYPCRSRLIHQAVSGASRVFARAPIIADPVQHRSTMIFFHDRSDDPERYRSVFTMLGPLASSVRLILPWMPADSDTQLPNWMSKSSCQTISTSTAIHDLIRQESSACKNVFLGGFGDGADFALNLGLDGNVNLNGIVSLCATQIPSERHNQVPILAIHGQQSHLLPDARKKYRELGCADFICDASTADTFTHEMLVQMCYWMEDNRK